MNATAGKNVLGCFKMFWHTQNTRRKDAKKSDWITGGRVVAERRQNDGRGVAERWQIGGRGMAEERRVVSDGGGWCQISSPPYCLPTASPLPPLCHHTGSLGRSSLRADRKVGFGRSMNAEWDKKVDRGWEAEGRQRGGRGEAEM